MLGIHDCFEYHVPAFDICITQKIAINKFCRFLFECRSVLCFGLFTCKEKQGVFIPNKLGYQRSLSHSPASIQYDKCAAIPLILTLQRLHLLLSINKLLHKLTASIKYYTANYNNFNYNFSDLL